MAGVALAGWALVAGGCSRALESAETASREFHARYERAAYADVYREAAPELRQTVSETDFVKMMEGLARKLGGWRSSKDSAWKVFVGTGGQTVTLQYGTEFERASATEQFVWRVDGAGKPLLVGYNVNSPALLTN